MPSHFKYLNETVIFAPAWERDAVGDEPKQQVTLRLAPKVIRYFKETGEGWQTRLNETLEEYVTTVTKKRQRSR